MLGVAITLGFIVLCALLWVAFKLTGAILEACFWLLIQVPLALVFWILGIALCCTLLLIPVGKWSFRLGSRIIKP